MSSDAIDINLLTVTAGELQNKLESGAFTSTQLVEKCLSQIAKHDGYLHAMITTAPLSSLLERARKLDKERSEKGIRSKLHGIPIILKDSIATHPDLGMDTTAGSCALKGSRPKRNAELVEKLLKAGTIILGKANLSEFSSLMSEDAVSGWSAVGGQTQSAYVLGGIRENDNPAGHSTPGGSSSGSAVGVSAGYAPISIGVETAGSIVGPAGRAALYSIKPTIGLISQHGIIPISSCFDSAGPMTKSVEDLANLLDILVDRTKTTVPSDGYAAAATGSWDKLRIGVLDKEEWEPTNFGKEDAGVTLQLHNEARKAYQKIKPLAESFQEDVSLVSVDELFTFDRCWQKLLLRDFKKEFNEYLGSLETSPVKSLGEVINYNKEHRDQELPPNCPNQDLLTECASSNISQEEYDMVLNHTRRLGRERGIDRTLEAYKIDIILGPNESEMPLMAAASGYPIATVPLGYLDLNGRPHGLVAIAGAGKEATLIQFQSAWEATFPTRSPPPMQFSS